MSGRSVGTAVAVAEGTGQNGYPTTAPKVPRQNRAVARENRPEQSEQKPVAGRPHADSPECTELRSLLRASGLTLSEAWRLYEATFPWPKLVKARFSDWLNGKEKLNATLLFRWRSILADYAVPVGSTSTMRTLEGKAAAQYEKQLRAEGFEPFRADDFGPVETPRDHAEALAQWQEEFDRDFDAERDTPMPSPGPISPEEGRDMEWETGRRKPSLLRGLRGY